MIRVARVLFCFDVILPVSRKYRVYSATSHRDGVQVIVTHPRSYDKDQRPPRHIGANVRPGATGDRIRLIQAAPNSRELLTQAAVRGDNLASITDSLLHLLADYGS